MNPLLIFKLLPFVKVLGGVRSLIVAAAGIAVGLIMMRLIAEVYLIPLAEAEARAEVRAEFATAAAQATIEAARRSREIEERIDNASDDEIRRLLRGPGR